MCAQSFTPEQKTEVVSWANGILKRYGKQIQNCKNDCQDGTCFILLIEAITESKLGCDWAKKPAGVVEKRSNVGLALQFLEENSIIPGETITVDNVMWDKEAFSLTILKAIQTKLRKGNTHQIRAEKTKLAPLHAKGVKGSGSLVVKKQAPEPSKLFSIKPGGMSPKPKDDDKQKVVKRAKIWDIGHDPRAYDSMIAMKRKKQQEEEQKGPDGKKAKVWDIGHDSREWKEREKKEQPQQQEVSQLPALNPRESGRTESEGVDPGSVSGTRGESARVEEMKRAEKRKVEEEKKAEEEKKLKEQEERKKKEEEKKQKEEEARKKKEEEEKQRKEEEERKKKEEEEQKKKEDEEQKRKEEEERKKIEEEEKKRKEEEKKREEEEKKRKEEEKKRKEEEKKRKEEEKKRKEEEERKKREEEERQRKEEEERKQKEEEERKRKEEKKRQREAEKKRKQEEQKKKEEEKRQKETESKKPDLPLKLEEPEIVEEFEPDWTELEDHDPEAALVQALKRPDSARSIRRSTTCVGIDLGTSYCRFSVYNGTERDGRLTQTAIPSTIVYIGNEKKVGEEFADYITDEEAEIVGSAKCLVGTTFVREDIPSLTRKVGSKISLDGKTLRAVIQLCKIPRPKDITAEEVIASLLSQVKKLLLEQLNEDVVDAVISVPAFFSNGQRQATIDAAKIAGFNVMRLISETVGALITRQQEAGKIENETDEKNIVAIDFGAGKLDMSVVKSKSGTMTICTTAGDTKFGGADFDEKMAAAMAKELETKSRIRFSNDSVSMRRLKFACHDARHTLSSLSTATIAVDDIVIGTNFERQITRDEMETILAPHYTKFGRTLENLFSGNVSVKKGDIHEVLMIGGMCKDPKIKSIVRDFFSDEVTIIDCPEDAVVNGVSLQGAILKADDETAEQLPHVKVENSTPLSLGFSLVDGTVSILIPRGTVIPCSFSTITTTFKDNQRNVGFDIIEGERRLAKDNIKLGDVCVEGIEKAPKGVPKIRVEFIVNEDGILVVTAKDQKTGVVIQTTIESRSNLSNDQIQRIVAEAEAHKAEDEKTRRSSEWRSRLHFYIDRARKQAAELAKDRREKALEAVQHTEAWLKEHQSEEIADPYINKYFSLKKVMKAQGATAK